MTEQELRNWFATQPAQTQDFVEETVALTSVSVVQNAARIKYGHDVPAKEAEAIAARWRFELVEAIPILRVGGALAPDMWRPEM